MSVSRIAVVAYHSNPLDPAGSGDAGGMTVYVRAVAAALTKHGVQTDIFTRSTTDVGRIHTLSDGVRVVGIDAGPRRPLPKDELRAYRGEFEAGVRAFAASQRIRYDVVHSHYWQSGIAMLSAAAAWDVPLVHSNHTLGLAKEARRGSDEKPEPPERIAAERRLASNASVLLAASQEEASHLVGLYGAGPDRVKVISPGVDHSLFRPATNGFRRRPGVPADPYVLYAGRIQPLKGLDLAIEAVAAARRDFGCDVKLLVVGGESGGHGEIDRLEKIAAACGISDNVVFLGPVSHESLPDLYRAARAVLLCSHSESFGLMALEAQACGTPVVATPVGGIPEVVRHGASGWIVDRRDARAVARGLAAVVARGRSPAMKAEAVAAARPFSWESTAAELVDLYRCLVEEHLVEACTC